MTRKPGRPPRAGKATTEKITIKLTRGELARLRAAARAAGLTVSALVRLRCLGVTE